MKTFIQFVLATSILLIGCTTDSEQPTRTITAGKYENTSIGLSILFPTTWQIKPGIHSQLSQRILDLSSYWDSIYSMNGKEIGEFEYESSNNGILLHYLQIIFLNKGKDVSVSFTDRADDFPLNQDIKAIKSSITVK